MNNEKELRAIKNIFIWGIAAILTLGALMIACHGAPKGPYQMNNEDHEHLLHLITTQQLLTEQYKNALDKALEPAQQEMRVLIERNCKRAGFTYGVDCNVQQDGSVTKQVQQPAGKK